MATKTSGKTATPKPAPIRPARKSTAPQKPADFPSKTKKQLETDIAPQAAPPSVRQGATEPEKIGVSGQASPHPKTVSLIDRKKPAKKSQDGEVKPKRTV